MSYECKRKEIRFNLLMDKKQDSRRASDMGDTAVAILGKYIFNYIFIQALNKQIILP